MKKINGNLPILIAYLSFFAFNSFAKDTLTLQQCLELGKNNNPDLLQAKEAIVSARAGILSARSSFYPNIDLSTGHRKTDAIESSYSTSIGLRSTLYQGGYIRAGKNIAEHRLKIAEENYRLKEQEVSFSIKQTFFEILQKMDLLSGTDEVLKRRKEALMLIKLKYEAGRENEPSVQEAATDLLQAEYDKLTKEEDLKLAKIKLNRLLGWNIHKEIAIKYSTESIKNEIQDFLSREELIRSAKQYRPEIRIENENREILQAQLKQARSNYFPSVSLSSSYGYSGDEFLNQIDNSSWNAGVNLSFSIFNGFSTHAKTSDVISDIRQQDTKIRSRETQIEEEVEAAYSRWILAKKNLELSEKTMDSAKNMYLFTKLQYEQGRTSYFFLQQKELSLTRAEYTYINALFNLQVATANIYKVMGID